MLKDRIVNKETGFLLYGLTPPKITTEVDKIRIIADRQIERLKSVKIDGLVLYDIQVEVAIDTPIMKTEVERSNYIKR